MDRRSSSWCSPSSASWRSSTSSRRSSLTRAGDVRQGRWPTPPPPSTTSPIRRERAIAERGRYIVMTHRLHRLPRDQRLAGARLTKYLAGGGIKIPDAARHVRQPQPDARPGNRPRPPHRRRGQARAAKRRRSPTATSTDCTVDAVGELLELDRRGSSRRRRLPAHLPPVRHEIPEPMPARRSRFPGPSSRTTAAKDYGTATPCPVAERVDDTSPVRSQV